ncbi:ANTAR domain-containing protein [Actinacidiphila sp. ITFR-21]|uniref:ANTAR domain-containing protein n=1 Tax=Actinacidiphila sp. ITFR-21 TaxID=3075199 RepID=UPI00288B1E6E|nr:ANTAR domain-containing protein [Streptomyces sp. ITFR-21]WNI14284.1 ANTAR domain-containing protein [Streptomyces sp. ITFR-21]
MTRRTAQGPHRPASPSAAEGAHGELDHLREEAAGLRRALESYPTIDMARGVVMAIAPCGKDEAWGVLVEVSQHANVKLRDVARDILAGVVGGPVPPPVRRALAAALERLGTTRR